VGFEPTISAGEPLGPAFKTNALLKCSSNMIERYEGSFELNCLHYGLQKQELISGLLYSLSMKDSQLPCIILHLKPKCQPNVGFLLL
jgi:hypothetical protein